MGNRVQTINVQESELLLKTLLNEKGTNRQRRKGQRNYTMALLMLDAGLRVGEVVKLRKRDLIFQTQPVFNLLISTDIAKRGLERTIPLTDLVRRAIENLCNNIMYKHIFHTDSFAFYDSDPAGHVTTRQVHNIIRFASGKAIGREIHPHILRHTFATRCMRKSNTRVVQTLLGHKHLSSTQIYTHPDLQDLTKVIKGIQT